MRPVPDSQLIRSDGPIRLGEVAELRDFVAAHPKLFVITGAGSSHASGIPTYRDEIGTWKGNTPIQHGEFMTDPDKRKRYWARSFRGWPTIADATPNPSHHALAALEAKGYIDTLVTQNVDGLHQKAGQRRVVDLHGRLDAVLCMDCGARSSRAALQERLRELNPHFELLAEQALVVAPDGDADVRQSLVDRVTVPDCEFCAGMLKPDVVFYGGSVRKDLVSSLFEKLSQASGVLVVGSSLMVYSSFRFCKFASENAIPMACVNQGLTRADALYTLKVNADCGQTLQFVAENLPTLDR